MTFLAALAAVPEAFWTLLGGLVAGAGAARARATRGDRLWARAKVCLELAGVDGLDQSEISNLRAHAAASISMATTRDRARDQSPWWLLGGSLVGLIVYTVVRIDWGWPGLFDVPRSDVEPDVLRDFVVALMFGVLVPLLVRRLVEIRRGGNPGEDPVIAVREMYVENAVRDRVRLEALLAELETVRVRLQEVEGARASRETS